MKPLLGGFLVTMCAVLLASCATDRTGLAPQDGHQAEADASVYPHLLTLGHSIYRVDREPDSDRLKIDFVRWSGMTTAGAPEALFRVTNPGPRSALVWNVRLQVLTTNSEAAAPAWETKHNDYPDRWDHVDIPAAGSAEFPMLPPMTGVWRVCLLYSRELFDSHSTNRQFAGEYELLGPNVPQPSFPDE
jgi:hypothetical protein